MKSINVIYEDNHLLVVNKKAGLPTMGAESGPSLHSTACQYLREKYNKPGNAYLGIVSRLDSLTSGVIALAKTSKAAARLNQQFSRSSENAAVKTYLAITQGNLPTGSSATWTDHLIKDEAAHRMRITDHQSDASKEGSLTWLSLHGQANWSLAAVRLHTGRKHQIRVQFSNRDHAVLGDKKYDATRKFDSGIALHSWHLSLCHPTRKEMMSFDAPPPKSWESYLQQVPPSNHPDKNARLMTQIEDSLGH